MIALVYYKEALFKAGHFPAAQGRDHIYYRHFPPPSGSKEPRITLTIIHDFYDYHIHYNNLISRLLNLSRSKICMGCLDLKGCGLSMGVRGHIDDLDKIVLDVVNFLNNILKRDTFLLGQGSGALIALRLLQNFKHEAKYDIKGLVLSNPFFGFRRKGWEKGIRFLMKQGGSFLSRIRMPYAITGDMLTHCREAAERHDSDPLTQCHFSVGLFNELLKASKKVDDFKTDFPTLMLIGQNDPLCDSTKGVLYAQRMNCSLETYDDMKHDLFNDSNSIKVIQDIDDWLAMSI